MKKTLIQISITTLTLFFYSCSVGYEVDKTFTPLKTYPCDTIPENVELFFEGETTDFEYEKIGLIEIMGKYSSTDAEMIEEVKSIAKKKCCNAVIFIKKNYVEREKSVLFSSAPVEKYTTIVYNGIAVRKINR
ncbi:hypothetical protein ACFSX9_01130 [Flavobacterium ardleyense]|uniref:Lipoprotein n=1 Tax=Flavobacterium ardleyense TaxID=2038737 RepID=A0ABW5Z4I4_9FLAO